MGLPRDRFGRGSVRPSGLLVLNDEYVLHSDGLMIAQICQQV